ncbi:MAG: hypothetical protein KF699_04860 [Phycisphaeraceae bacterium]|nr:hypothetical protein [Phycisphaeraceae bacterium]
MNSSTTEIVCEVRVPRETVNDDVVTVQSWQRSHGDAVRKGECVVHIETSKAVLEVESEGDGFLEVLHGAGSEVPIGELIGRVLVSQPPALRLHKDEPAAPPPPTPPPAAGMSIANGATGRTSNRLRDRMESSGVGNEGRHGVPAHQEPAHQEATYPDAAVQTAISKKAQRLIDEHGIDASVFAHLPMVREADVIRYLERRTAERMSREPAPPSPAAAAATERAQREAASSAGPRVDGAYPGPKSRGLFGDAAASAKDRGNRSIVWLAWNYFWRNWLLGNLARWAPRGVILPIHRMRGVRMGTDVFIDPTAIIETAFPENITIGNDVRITAGCVIMSHIKAPHYLRETGLVPVVLKPVVLEDHCFIGVNSVIMPGVTVGKASVVTSGSVVVSNVPPYTMVQGNPAKVIKQFPRPD